MASACLFLAGKVEETPKKAKDIFRTIQAHGLLTESAMAAAFGDDPKVISHAPRNRISCDDIVLLDSPPLSLVGGTYDHGEDAAQNYQV